MDNLTVKAVGDFILDVLGIPFYGPMDGRDAHGEFFDDETELLIDELHDYPVVHYHSMEEEDGLPDIIGKARYNSKDERGVWFRVTLDKTKKISRELFQAAHDNVLRASTGAVGSLTRVNEATGAITFWPIGELSLMDARTHRPANMYAVALPASKATWKAAGLTPPVYYTTESVEGGKTTSELSERDRKRIVQLAAKEVKHSWIRNKLRK